VVVQVIVGVVFNPVLDEMFVAVRGEGATRNGSPIHVSGESQLGKALVATEIGVTRDQGTIEAVFHRVLHTASASRSLRCSGSCAMNIVGVAMGRLDAFFEVGFGGPWDVAAASLIVQEAGGTVLDPCGSTFDLMGRRVLAGTPAIAGQLALLLQGCKTSVAEPPPPIVG
jgi:inositol-phosphate phosphatase / L-galactose 1-phosphate phosphatase